METSASKPAQAKAKGTTVSGREDRLKAALKANMARRKAQAKARAGAQTGAGPADDDEQQKGG